MLTFRDLMTEEVIFFEKNYKDECLSFCKERNIDVLPAYHDDLVYYQLDKSGQHFHKKELLDARKKRVFVQDLRYEYNRILSKGLMNLLQTYTEERINFQSILQAVERTSEPLWQKLENTLRQKLLCEMGLETVDFLIDKSRKESLEPLVAALMEAFDWLTGKQQQLQEDIPNQVLPYLDERLRPGMLSQIRKELPDRMRFVQVNEYVFKEEIVEKFRAHDLLFVMQEGTRVGVVHFSDYNDLKTFVYTYERVHQMETEMREALHLVGVTLGEAMEVAGDGSGVQAIAEIRAGNPRYVLTYHDLNGLYLRSLIRMYNNREEWPHIRNSNLILFLRNNIAHSAELVELMDKRRVDLVYDFTTFEKFLEAQKALDLAVKQVKANNFYFKLKNSP
ncbi:MAG: hypothetical protein AAGI38_07760 [Bacteroidota bacterium]